MKRTLIMLGAVVALAGCNQGGTSDQYSTGTGKDMSTNAPATKINSPPPVAAPSPSGSIPNANPSQTPPSGTSSATSTNADVTRPGDQPNPSKP